jgi:Fe-S-cluster containining protein
MPADASLQEQILRDYPRLGPGDRFTFRCGKDLECFTRCCRDVSIVLTPYDVLRMKKALGITSTEFLERYALLPFAPEQKIPVVLLKMDPEVKQCPFVGPDGCSIYAHRPWACRMYPLGVADPKNPSPADRRFHFLLQEELCRGHGQGKVYTVREWLEQEGIEEYDMMGAPFRDLMLDDFWERGQELTPQQVDMYFMACYDLDRFRRFVFETKFLELFEVDEARVEAMRSDDLELLEFGTYWLRFSLFHQKTLKIKPSAAEARRRAAERRANPNG